VQAPGPVLSENAAGRGRNQLGLQWTASTDYSGVSLGFVYESFDAAGTS
jgi:hypothetical protein